MHCVCKGERLVLKGVSQRILQQFLARPFKVTLVVSAFCPELSGIKCDQHGRTH